MLFNSRTAVAVAVTLALPLSYAQTTTTCQPLNGTCPNDLGLATSTYSIDFTTAKSVPSDWSVANYETVNFGAQGAELTFAKRYDAPTFFTNFKILFGHIEYVVQGAPGQGIVSSMVLLSDDLDEIDWEMTGTGENHIQTNYYGKGFLNYNVGRYVNVTSPQTSFHTYALDWTADTLIWSIDQVVVRTLKASEAGNYFPQTPMKVSLSLWDGGDPSEPVGTKNWAGGETTLPPPKPYTMYIKSVKITNATPAQQYQYTDKSGSWQSIKVVDEPFNSSTSSVSSSQSVVASIPLGPTGTATIPTIQSGSSISLSGTSSGIVGIAPSSRASVAISPTSAATNTPMTPVVFSKSTSATAASVTAPAVVSLASNIAPLSTPALPTGTSGSTHEILITQIVHTTLSTCPVTSMLTAPNGSRTQQIATAVSTILSTSTSTICTKCIAPTFSSATVASQTTQAVVTTEIVHTTISNCPITSTVTLASGTPTQHVTTILSTILSTSTSTICTKCLAPSTSITAPATSGTPLVSLGELGISKQASSSVLQALSNPATNGSIASVLSKANATASTFSTASTASTTQTTTSIPQGLFSMPPASAVSAIDSSMSLSSAAVAQTLTSRLTMTPTSTMTALTGGATNKVSLSGNSTLNTTKPAIAPFQGTASGSVDSSPIALFLALGVLVFL